MKTPEQWSAQIINTAAGDETGQVTIRFGSRALVLKGLAAQHADTLRAIVASALRSCVEEAIAAFSARGQVAPAKPALAAAGVRSNDNGSRDAGSKGFVAFGQGEGSARGLYGLPCPDCGAYFESRFQACPVCSAGSGRVAPESSDMDAGLCERNIAPPPALQPREAFSGDLLREGIGAEIVDACVRYGARMERMEAALRMTPEEAAKTVYETLFPSQARVQPWERCPQDFRSAYVLRVAVLLQELRRRAGLEPDSDPEFTIEAGVETVPARLCN